MSFKWLVDMVIEDSIDRICTDVLAKTSKNLPARVTFKKYVENCYGELSSYVHSITREDAIRVWFSDFDGGLFDAWYKKLREIWEICMVLFISRYPQLLKSEEKDVKSLLYSLPTNMVKEMKVRLNP